MIKYENLIYGTVRECVEEVWKLIDFKAMDFPDFDFAAWVSDYSTMGDLEAHGSDYASSWYGVKDLGNEFDSDTISLFFGHYGGGGVESMEIWGDSPEDKDLLIQKICDSTDGELAEDSPTLFELREGVF